jgi:putative phosphoribosyl transferase
MQWLTSRGLRFHRPKPFFADRAAAGRALAAQLTAYVEDPHVVVLALPRGGVPVAFEIAGALGAPLDVLLVCKLNTPGQEELAMGAIAEGDVLILNEEVIEALAITPDAIAAAVAAEQAVLTRRAQLYRQGKEGLPLQGRTVILVDDGLATGMTMRAAIKAARAYGASWIIVAVPVAASDTAASLRLEADELVAIRELEEFGAVGLWYEDFGQVSDDEVWALMREANTRRVQRLRHEDR